jgi:hypothetical protein
MVAISLRRDELNVRQAQAFTISESAGFSASLPLILRSKMATLLTHPHRLSMMFAPPSRGSFDSVLLTQLPLDRSAPQPPSASDQAKQSGHLAPSR